MYHWYDDQTFLFVFMGAYVSHHWISCVTVCVFGWITGYTMCMCLDGRLEMEKY